MASDHPFEFAELLPSYTVGRPAAKTPMEIAADNVARMNAMNPFLHAKRFEIQIHKGDDRRNIYLPTWELVQLVLNTKAFKADDPNRPDMVLVGDNRDTCVFVLRWEKSWYGYATTLRRGVAA